MRTGLNVSIGRRHDHDLTNGRSINSKFFARGATRHWFLSSYLKFQSKIHGDLVARLLSLPAHEHNAKLIWYPDRCPVRPRKPVVAAGNTRILLGE